MAMNISGFGTSNASYTSINTGNKGYKAAEEAVLADVMAEEAVMTPEQKMMYEMLGGREVHMKNMMRNYNSDGDYIGPGGIIVPGMKEFWNTIQLIFTAIGGWLGWFLGGCDGLLYALIAFVVVDYVTGVMCAVADKKLSSEVGFKGIAKKVLIFLLVGIANILDVQVIGSGSVLRTAVIFFYISNEGVSLLENAGHLGLPIPEKLKDILAQLHDRAESGKGDE